MDRHTVSLCMIVRDAERPLAAALDSARPLADEMIVVDTGSVDGTRQVAASRGARVCEFAWCDDFSAARNYSLAQATGDWIFWIDADDVVPPESAAELRRAIDGCPNRDAAFWATIEEASGAAGSAAARVMGHAHVKLFPRDERFRFRYRIHEQIAPALRAAGLPIRRTSAVIRHSNADRSPSAQQSRFERNLRLSLLDLQEHPDDPFVLLSLGTTYLFLPDSLPAAIDVLRRSIAGCKPGSEIQLNAYLYLGQALGTSGLRCEEEDLYREALALFPNDVPLLLRLGTLLERRGKLREAGQCYAAVLKRGRTRPSAMHVRGGEEQAALRLGALQIRTGHRDRAEKLWRNFLQRHPAATAVQQALAQSYLDPCSIIVGPQP